MSVTNAKAGRGGWNPPMPRPNSKSGPVDEPIADATADPVEPDVSPPPAVPPRAPPDIMADRATGPAEGRPDTMAALVVGWLVIVDGPGRGADFRLRPGMNTVGRGGGAAIDVDFGDRGISPGPHCRVTFDPRTAQFFLSPGDGNHLTYLPDDPVPVLMPVALRPMQDFEIGSTRLRLAPLCTPDFRWTD